MRSSNSSSDTSFQAHGYHNEVSERSWMPSPQTVVAARGRPCGNGGASVALVPENDMRCRSTLKTTACTTRLLRAPQDYCVHHKTTACTTLTTRETCQSRSPAAVRCR